MTAPKQHRWSCGECGSTVLAPRQPRKNDVRRFCLKCSMATGYLVERSCPTLDAKRAASKERSAAKSKAKRATASRQRTATVAETKAKLDARFVVQSPYVVGETIDMRKDLDRVWRAARKVEPRLRERAPKLVASRGSGSYASTYNGEIRIGSGASWHTLVHEVAHFVRARQGNEVRSDGKRAVHDRAFYHVLRDVMELLVPGLTVSFYDVTSWGYGVDYVISRQVYQLRKEAA